MQSFNYIVSVDDEPELMTIDASCQEEADQEIDGLSSLFGLGSWVREEDYEPLEEEDEEDEEDEEE
jgi:hypothetical protein